MAGSATRKLAIAALLLIACASSAGPARAQKVDLQDRLSKVRVVEEGERLRVQVETDAGPRSLSPEEFARAIREAQAQQDANFLYGIFNITSAWGILWVSVGFLGQALFTFRMVLQWLVSEKEKRSVVPVAFWWGSLFGGMMLFAYFVWRKDIVGIVGQSTGVFVYARNLVLIYRQRGVPETVQAGDRV